jgi:hypothetical protein
VTVCPESFSPLLTCMRVACHAGASPKISPVTTDTIAANTKICQLNRA